MGVRLHTHPYHPSPHSSPLTPLSSLTSLPLSSAPPPDMGVRLHDGLVQPRITKARMSPFQGLEDDSPAMVAALVGFSYHTGEGVAGAGAQVS